MRQLGNIQSLGVFVRYVPQDSTSNGFYEDRIGFPLIRKVNAAAIFWAGEAVTFETIQVAEKPAFSPEDITTPAWLPAYRVTDLDALTAQYAAASIAVQTDEIDITGRQSRVADPDGLAVVLRERPVESPFLHDVEARRRQSRGETFNPGSNSMPAFIQELGWIIRQVVDLPRMTAYYAGLGLTQVGTENSHPLFDLGDNVLLELQLGGVSRAAVKHRYETSDAPLVRVTDLPAMKSVVAALGGSVVHEHVNLPWGDLSYFADPEGGVLGMEQNFHPSFKRDGKFFLVENIESARRWRERVAAARI